MDVTVNQILAKKGRDVCTVDVGCCLYDCAQIMRDNGVGSLVVMSNNSVVGILHERDISRVGVASKMDLDMTSVREIMLDNFAVVSLQTTAVQAMIIISRTRVRHLPVIEKNKLVGIISIGDLNQWILELQQEDINHLINYIHGDSGVCLNNTP